MCLSTCLLYILIVSCRINNSQARTKQYDDRLIQLKDYEIKILQQNARFSDQDRKIDQLNIRFAEQGRRMAEHKTLIMKQNTLIANHKTEQTTLIANQKTEQNILIANQKTLIMEQNTLIANQKTLIMEQNVELCKLKTQVEMLQTTQMEILRKLQINKLKQSEKNSTSTSSPIIPSSGSPVTQPPIEARTATVEPAPKPTTTVQPASKPITAIEPASNPTTTVQPVPEPTTTVQPVPEPTVFLKCDFSEDMCGWIHDTKYASYGWTRHRGQTVSDYTGPNGDHTTGTGYYIYWYNQKPGYWSRIISPHIRVNTGQKSCFTFWYYMFGVSVNPLYVRKSENSNYGKSIWKQTGPQGKSWKQAVIELDGTSTDFQIALQAISGSGKCCHIAVDDITITMGSCSEFLNCDFSVGMCGWIQDKTDQFDWVRNSGPTSSSDTGPNGDHTTGNGYYVYIETSSRKPGDVARIISPHITVNTGQKSCFTFWYNMFGDDVNQLAVYKRKNGKNGNAIWRKTGTQGTSWHQAVIELDGSSTEFQIVLQGTRGLSLYGDIAVDDINIIKGSCSDPLYAHKAVSDSIAVGDSMYVQVKTPAIAADLKMVLTDCYAKPTVNADRSKWHTLIKNGCEIDPSTHIIRFTNTETRFFFTAFAFPSGEKLVDVHCDVRFCYNVKRSTSCRHGCNSNAGIIG